MDCHCRLLKLNLKISPPDLQDRAIIGPKLKQTNLRNSKNPYCHVETINRCNGIGVQVTIRGAWTRLSDAASLSRSLVVCQTETASKYRKFRNGVQLRVAVRSHHCGIDYYFLKSNFVDVHHVPPFYLFT